MIDLRMHKKDWRRIVQDITKMPIRHKYSPYRKFGYRNKISNNGRWPGVWGDNIIPVHDENQQPLVMNDNIINPENSQEADEQIGDVIKFSAGEFFFRIFFPDKSEKNSPAENLMTSARSEKSDFCNPNFRLSGWSSESFKGISELVSKTVKQ